MPFIAGAICEKCGKAQVYNHFGKTYITKWIRELGWSVSGNKTTCPSCRNKKKEVQP